MAQEAESKPPPAASTSNDSDKVVHLPNGYTRLPNGVVLDQDGKPCRTCNSLSNWRKASQMMKAPGDTAKVSESKSTPTPTAADASRTPARDCPPDVEALGRSSWTLLHSIAATYPERPSPSQQSDLLSFVKLFSKLYPCWVCADDFQGYIARERPQVGGRREFGWWLCGAHNDVNRKLGKAEFDCSKWEERWRTGWKDGSCN